jgi:hypothetical protein
MESLVTNIRESMNNNLSDSINESPISTSSNDTRDFRQIRIPETKIGLGSNEGDLIFMAKKYLEIVGLVFFVWLLGKWAIQFLYFSDYIFKGRSIYL